jgi:broad specificity phosphatase PhoE
MAPSVWLVRHAPTRDNLDGVIMGQRDPACAPDGLLAAAGVAPGVTFARAVASDTRRAAETARAIAPGAPLRLDERLRERSFGEWEGRGKRALQAAHPDAFTARGAVRLDFDPPGGEPLAALLARVHAALADLATGPGGTQAGCFAESPLLVVAHNGSLRAALVLLGQASLAQAATMSLDFLRPVVVDAGRLCAPRLAR